MQKSKENITEIVLNIENKKENMLKSTEKENQLSQNQEKIEKS